MLDREAKKHDSSGAKTRLDDGRSAGNHRLAMQPAADQKILARVADRRLKRGGVRCDFERSAGRKESGRMFRQTVRQRL